MTISVELCKPNRDFANAWDGLVTRASANAFMNPAALQAAGGTLFAVIHVLLAWDIEMEPQKLVGVWAMQVRSAFMLWPEFMESLPYNYAFVGSPVIDPAYVGDVMPAFLAAIHRHPHLPKVLSLKDMDADSPSYAALQGAIVEQGYGQLKIAQYQRPTVSRAFGVKASGSTRKKLRQDWNRLAALGAVDVVNDRNPAAAAAAFEVFLEMERQSWKGEQGTALLSVPKDAQFARTFFDAMASAGDASVAVLRLDGKPIATQVLLYCGRTAYTWKTCFDAEYGRFSPGTLVVDKVTEQLFAGDAIDAIDSCSVESSFMAQLWAGRRTMADVLIDVGPRRSAAFRIESWRRTMTGRLKALRNQWRGQGWLAMRKKRSMVAR